MVTFGDADGTLIRPGFDRIAALVGCHVDTVARSVARLEAWHELKRTGGGVWKGSAACFTFVSSELKPRTGAGLRDSQSPAGRTAKPRTSAAPPLGDQGAPSRPVAAPARPIERKVMTDEMVTQVLREAKTASLSDLQYGERKLAAAYEYNADVADAIEARYAELHATNGRVTA
jgi:hypothetical protein